MAHRFKIIRVIIAGGRNFDDYDLLKRKLDTILRDRIIARCRIIIVSGTARGTDQLGERYATEHEWILKRFPANWRPNGVYDNAAGFKRNVQMAEYATHLVAFWDGQSRGTQHMIKLAEKYGLNIRIIRY